MQIFVVSFALSLVIWKILPGKRINAKRLAYAVCLTILLANPVMLNRLAQIYPEPLLTVGLLMLSVLLYKGKDLGTAIFCSLTILTILFTVGLRYNAAAIAVPLLFLAVVRACPSKFLRIFSVTTLVLLSSFSIYKLPAILGRNKGHNVAYILVWDYIGTVMLTSSPEREYKLGEILPFKDSVALYDSLSNNSLQWGPQKIPPARIIKNPQMIYSEFASLVIRHPDAFAELRFKRLVNLLTLGSLPELDGPYEAPIYSGWGAGGPVDINFDPLFPGLRDWLVKLYLHEGHHWLYKPPFVIITSFLLVTLLKALRLPMRLEGCMMLVAILYYLTFALITPKVSYRFFFPTYLILMTISCLAVGKVCLLVAANRFASINQKNKATRTMLW